MKLTKSQLTKIIKEESRAARHEKRQAIFQDLDAMSDEERSAWWKLAWDQMGAYNAKELLRQYSEHQQKRANAARTLRNMNALLDNIADIYKGAYPDEVFGKLEKALEDAEKTLNFDEIKNMLSEPGEHGYCDIYESPLGAEWVKWKNDAGAELHGHGNVRRALKHILVHAGQHCSDEPRHLMKQKVLPSGSPGGHAPRGPGWYGESKMKLTKSQLKQIIKEELSSVLAEGKYKPGDKVKHRPVGDEEDLGVGEVVTVGPGKEGTISVKWKSGKKTPAHHRWALKPAPLDEKKLTKPEKKEKERIVKGMKKDKKGFKKRK